MAGVDVLDQTDRCLRQVDHDAGEDDERDAVADTALGDLLAEPHNERRARGERQHRHDGKSESAQ